MRQRDLAILFLCAVAVLLSFQSSDHLLLRKAFHHPIDVNLYRNHDHATYGDRLPPPLITDLDGDGSNEIVLVTREPKLKVLDYQQAKKHSRQDWPTLPPRAEVSLLPPVRIAVGRQPVALASGYVSEYESDVVNRDQIICVVTQGWTVLCFDLDLKPLWEHTVHEGSLTGLYHREVSILISSVGIHEGDKGSVIVGGSLDYIPAEEHEHVEDFRDLDDVQESNLEQNIHHFSLYAFDGSRGQLRWKHEANDFHDEVHADEVFVPQHNYKVEVQSHIHHSGEVDWRVYRDAFLEQLPHRWTQREDTTLELAHFGKKREIEAEKSDTGGGPEHVGLSGQHIPAYFKDLAAPHSDADHVVQPNVVVAKVMHGIEVVHLYTGRTLCQLTLPSAGLFGDFNHDGVIDHVETYMGPDGVYSVDDAKDGVHGCMAYSTSGIPPIERMFNASLCDKPGSISSNLKRVAGDDIASGLVDGLPPVMLQVEMEKDGHNVQHRHALFLLSDGKLTNIAPDGTIKWQQDTLGEWTLIQRETVDALELDTVSHPHIEVFSLEPGSHVKHQILVVGEYGFEVLSHKGQSLLTGEYSDPPQAPPLIGDFNNDGVNDLIFITKNHFYGYTLERRPGSLILTVVVGLFVVVVGFTLVASVVKGVKKRGTD